MVWTAAQTASHLGPILYLKGAVFVSKRWGPPSLRLAVVLRAPVLQSFVKVFQTALARIQLLFDRLPPLPLWLTRINFRL